MGIATSRIEFVEEIRRRLVGAAEPLPTGRLIAGPGCGLGYLGREVALTKLRNLADAAHSLSD